MSERLPARVGPEAALVEAYLLDLRSEGSRHKMRQVLGPVLEQLGPVQDLTRERLLHWRNAAAEAGLAPATINVRLAAVRGVLRVAAERELISFERLARLSIPGLPADKEERPALAVDVVGKLLHTVRTRGTQARRDGAALALCLIAGLRREEAASVSIGSVDVESGVLRVAHGKGNKARSVPLSPLALQLLAEWLLVRLDCESAYRTDAAPVLLRVHRGGSVLWQRGLQPWGVWRAVVGLARRAGVEHVHTHKLRRTFATLVLRETGGDVFAAQKLLGHSSSATTQIYDGRGWEAGRSAVGKLDALLRRL